MTQIFSYLEDFQATRFQLFLTYTILSPHDLCFSCLYYFLSTIPKFSYLNDFLSTLFQLFLAYTILYPHDFNVFLPITIYIHMNPFFSYLYHVPSIRFRVFVTYTLLYAYYLFFSYLCDVISTRSQLLLN